MPLYQASELTMSSGALGVTQQSVERLQSVQVSYSPPRADVGVLGRFKVLNDRPVINYIPAAFSFNLIKATKEVETNLGLINPTGVGIVFAGTDGFSVNGFGARNFNVLVSPSQANNYNGQMSLLSGVLNSYSVSAGVGQPTQMSVGGEALDLRFVANTAGKASSTYNSLMIKSENVAISGIDISGFGLSGLTVQSFDLGLSIGRQSSFQLGQKYPSRLVTDIKATVAIRAFFEGINTSFTGLNQFDCGTPYTGSFFFTLVPSCFSSPATTYIAVNPYLTSFQYGAQVGSFSSIDLNFDIPISLNSGEAVIGSNLIIL